MTQAPGTVHDTPGAHSATACPAPEGIECYHATCMRCTPATSCLVDDPHAHAHSRQPQAQTRFQTLTRKERPAQRRPQVRESYPIQRQPGENVASGRDQLSRAAPKLWRLTPRM